MLITWLHFGEFFFFLRFLKRNSDVFFKAKHFIGHTSGVIGPIDMERTGSASVGYWVYYVATTFDLDFGSIKFQFRNSQESLAWLMWNEEEVNQLDTVQTRWPGPLTTPMISWLRNFKCGIAAYREWEGWLTWAEGCESSIQNYDSDFVSQWWGRWMYRRVAGPGWLQTSTCCRHM